MLITISGSRLALFISAACVASAFAEPCPTPSRVGYRIMTLSGGVKAAVWYPTTAAEVAFPPVGLQGSVALNAVPAGCGPSPLIVFSHGYLGCGIQSTFITETLARRGYIVAAPDHADRICSVDGSGPGPGTPGEPSVLTPWVFTDVSYLGRKNDVKAVIDTMLQDPLFGPLIDPQNVGAAGHSLGGYTVMGVAGGWASWKDSRIKAVLAVSPLLQPFSFNHKVSGIQVPIMYQGAQGDFAITPFIQGADGGYAQSNPPKYFAVLSGGDHFTWADIGACVGKTSIAACLKDQPHAQLIVDYAVQFLDRVLKGGPVGILHQTSAGLASYDYAELPIPAAPTNVALSDPSMSTLILSWTAPADATITGYQVDVTNASNFSPLLSAYSNLGVGNKTSLQVSGLLPGTTYYARVRAYNTEERSSVNSVVARAVTLGAVVNSPVMAPNIENVRVWPNPWRTDRHTGLDVTFSQLTAGATIKIFDVSGRWVRTLTPTSDEITWDRRNDKGQVISSGVYIYLVTDPTGAKTRGKLTVIR